MDYELDSDAICEAVSIELTDSSINYEAIPDTAEILRHCSSLIRGSVGEGLEFAHFTVKELFSQLENARDDEFAAYRMDAKVVKQELAKVCLTYITMSDFDYCRDITMLDYDTLMEEYPLLQYIDWEWPILVQDWHDTELVELLKKFLDPSKKGALVSWAQRDLYPDQGPEALEKVTIGVKGATALHFASMLCIPEICEWLIASGSDVNSQCVFGTPLHCAIITRVGFTEGYLWSGKNLDFSGMSLPASNRRLATINLLLAAGSDPTTHLNTGEGDLSPLALALRSQDPIFLALRLFAEGGSLHKQDLDHICMLYKKSDQLHLDGENILLLAQKMSEGSSNDRIQGVILRQALVGVEEGETGSRLLLANEFDNKEPTGDEEAELEANVRTAAEYGQLRLMVHLLDRHAIFIDSACQDSGETAIHYAAANDHLDIMEALFARGADLAITDAENRSAIHYSISGSGYRCLEFLLGHNVDVNITDQDGMTAWHEAISCDNIKALKMLAISHRYESTPPQETATPRSSLSPLSLAAKKAVSVEFLSLLITAGCSVQDVDDVGYTALHHAAEVCSVSKLQYLVENGSDVSAISQDGSSPLHLAVRSKGAHSYEGISYLIDNGSDGLLVDHDMRTPIDLWIEENLTEKDSELAKKTLQKLLQQREPHLSSQLDLSKSLLNLCRIGFDAESSWLSTVFETLLDNGADLTGTGDSGKTAFGILLESWLMKCSDLQAGKIDEFKKADSKPTAVVHIALDLVPLDIVSNPDHNLPGLLVWALTFGDEDLAWKVLAFSPDVDCVTCQERNSVAETAIDCDCSNILFKDILGRSRALTDQGIAASLYKVAIERDRLKFAEMLFEFGINLNSFNTQG